MKYQVLVNGLVVKNNKVLIIKRSKKEKHQAGMWTIPGGKLEELGEVFDVLEKTAEREVWEETGVVVRCLKSALINNTFTHTEDGTNVIAIIMLCEHLYGEASPMDDTDEVKWITKEELKNYDFSPNVKRYIKSYFKTYENKR